MPQSSTLNLSSEKPMSCTKNINIYRHYHLQLLKNYNLYTRDFLNQNCCKSVCTAKHKIHASYSILCCGNDAQKLFSHVVIIWTTPWLMQRCILIVEKKRHVELFLLPGLDIGQHSAKFYEISDTRCIAANTRKSSEKEKNSDR